MGFKTNKTLPLLDKQTDKCGGFVATTPVDDVRAFNSTTTQSIQKGDANRLVSPLITLNQMVFGMIQTIECYMLVKPP